MESIRDTNIANYLSCAININTTDYINNFET